MKNIKYKIITIVITIIPSFVFGASARYAVLAPLPYATPGGKGELASYISGLFKLLIGSGAVLAFLFIFWYGFEYMFSDSFLKKGNARERIIEVLGGLALIILSYVIIYNINPKFVEMTLTLKAPNVKSGTVDITAVTPVSAGATATSGYIAGTTETETRDLLVNKAGVSINAGPCPVGQTTGCTNVAGLPGVAISGLQSLKNSCNCSVMITGGTEPGHATHGPGKPIVDLSPTTDLNSFLKVSSPTEGKTVIVEVITGVYATFTFEKAGGNPNGTSTGDHWHVVFSS